MDAVNEDIVMKLVLESRNDDIDVHWGDDDDSVHWGDDDDSVQGMMPFPDVHWDNDRKQKLAREQKVRRTITTQIDHLLGLYYTSKDMKEFPEGDSKWRGIIQMQQPSKFPQKWSDFGNGQFQSFCGGKEFAAFVESENSKLRADAYGDFTDEMVAMPPEDFRHRDAPQTLWEVFANSDKDPRKFDTFVDKFNNHLVSSYESVFHLSRLKREFESLTSTDSSATISGRRYSPFLCVYFPCFQALRYPKDPFSKEELKKQQLKQLAHVLKEIYGYITRQIEYGLVDVPNFAAVQNDRQLRKTFLAKSKIIHKLDRLLGEYHTSRMSDDSYVDETGMGKFRLFCEMQAIDDGELQHFLKNDRQLTALHGILITEEPYCFGTPRGYDPAELQQEHLSHLLHAIYQRGVVPSDLELRASFFVKYKPISWWHIAESLKHEMYSAISTKMHEVIQDMNISKNIIQKDTRRKFVNRFINMFQEKRKLSNKEVVFIQNAVARAKKFKGAGDDHDGEMTKLRGAAADSVKEEQESGMLVSDEYYHLLASVNEQEEKEYFPIPPIAALQSKTTGRGQLLDLKLHTQALDVMDVYTVHKCHRYTFQQMDDYPFTEFLENAAETGDSVLKKLANSAKFRERAERLSLFPSWLVNDNVFSFISNIHGVTDFAQTLIQTRFLPSTLSLRMYIIPDSVVSVYDQSLQLNVQLPILAKYLKHNPFHAKSWSGSAGHQSNAAQVAAMIGNLYDAFDRYPTAQPFYDPTILPQHPDIVVLFGHKNYNNMQEVVMFECTDWSPFDELRSNNLVGFDIEIGGDDVARAYLNYGIRQRIRFYPEFMISLVPKLFVTPSTMTEYEYLQKLYSAEYKKGWNLNLDDQRFNDIYKAITGTTHETNNYYRVNGKGKEREQKYGFFRFVERRLEEEHEEVLIHLMAFWNSNRYDSDTVIDDILDRNTKNEEESNIRLFTYGFAQSAWMILKNAVFDWKKIECGTENVFNITDCGHIQRLIGYLKRFKESKYIIHSINMEQFNLSQIIGDFDHLVSVHNLFSGDDTHRIQRYISNQIDCERANDCLVVSQFRNRRRENEKHSNRKENDDVSSKCAVLSDTLCGIHCYLLHRTNELYCLSSEKEEAQSRFSSLVTEKKSNEDKKDDNQDDEPLAIDFGVSVIRWLPFGESPLFESMRDEMTQDKDSAVSQEGFMRMEIECAEKIKTEQFQDYDLEELMGLKFFSDYSKACANLRKAHWESMPLDMKKRHYHWARTIYRAALRHAVPIPPQSNSQKGAQWLYHGLTKLFTMDREFPTYFGPFSTTLSLSISDEFSEKKGMRLHIKPEYEDSMKRCLGIDMRSISCFKREQEILLVDQPIPIQSTKAWDLSDSVMIHQLMYSLKSRGTEIRDRNQFYKTSGLRFKSKWIKSIAEHHLLYVKSAYHRKEVIGRLVDELGILDVVYHSKYYSSQFAHSIMVKENEYISVALDSESNALMHETVSSFFDVFEFAVKNVTENQQDQRALSKSYRFSDIYRFKIPLRNHIAFQQYVEAANINESIQEYDIQIAMRVVGVFDDLIPIKTVRVPILPTQEVRYDPVSAARSFCINKMVKLFAFNESGSIQRMRKLRIVSSASITIEKEGGISCFNLGNSERQLSSESDDNADGGYISLLAEGLIVNDGALYGTSSTRAVSGSGTIFIATDGEFANTGRALCGENGSIRINCSKVVNEGYIEPAPRIHIMETPVMKNWIAVHLATKEEQQLKLKVVDYKGHWKKYRVDTAGCYVTSILMRNGKGNWAVERISIDGSADDKEYEHWMEIGGIKQNETKTFVVDVASSVHAAACHWRFYRINVLQNYGNQVFSKFAEFRLFGNVDPMSE